MATRKALGKGLGALILQKQPAKAAASEAVPEDRVILAKVSDILTSPFQPRRLFDEKQIEELADAIRENGLIQPLVVRQVDGKFELIAGERRLRAVTSLGHTEVKVIVREATDQEAATLTLIENLQRADLTPLEEAEQYRLLQVRFAMKQDDIARSVGKSRTVIANTIRLLELVPEARQMLEQNKITVGHAKVLLQLREHEEQTIATRRVVAGHLTVRQTEKLVRSFLMPDQQELPSVSSRTRQLPPSFQGICDQLSRDFGTRVNISMKSRSNGVIEIPYAGKEDLERILQIFGVSAQL